MTSHHMRTNSPSHARIRCRVQARSVGGGSYIRPQFFDTDETGAVAVLAERVCRLRLEEALVHFDHLQEW